MNQWPPTFPEQMFQTGHYLTDLAEHEMIVPHGIANLTVLIQIIEDDNIGLEFIVVETVPLYLEQIEVLSSHPAHWACSAGVP